MTAETPPPSIPSAPTDTTTETPSFPQAIVVSSSVPRLVSKLWWITGLSLVIAFVLVIGSQRRQGPAITIQFTDGHGLKAGDTLRYRGIIIGEVSEVALNPKLAGVVVSVNLEHRASSLARQGTEFWIERPQVSLARVTGLETVAGAKYLGVHPGPADAPVSTSFMGLESPPTLTESEAAAITIRFAQGYGLQIGDVLRHRGIVIGEVTTVDLEQDLSGVSVQVRLNGTGRQVAREGSLFWVERPRVTMSEVRGLDTIVGGRYIAVAPADGPADFCDSFTGLDAAPVTAIAPGGIEIVLHAPQRWGVERGVPVTYRGLRVGQVHSVGLSSDGSRIEARVIIEARYRRLVRQNSVFWSSSGIDVNVGLTGMQLTADTLSTIAQGGLAFATPDQPGEPAVSGQRFAYERTAKDEWTAWHPHISLDSPIPVAGKQPEPLRASVRWTQKSFGFSRAHERACWVVLLDSRRLVGPADVLLPTAQPQGDILLEVGGVQQTLDPKKIERTGSLATVVLDAEIPDGVVAWAKPRTRRPTDPEDLLIVADVQSSPYPLSASGIKQQEDGWVPENSSGLNPTWHGASVVSARNGDLIGMLVFRKNKPLIVAIPE